MNQGNQIQNIQPITNVATALNDQPKKFHLKLSLILSGVVSLLYGIGLLIFTFLEAGIAMSGGQNNSNIIAFIFLLLMGAPICLLVFHLVLLKRLLPYRTRFLILWCAASLGIGVFISPILFMFTMKGAEILVTPKINRMYAPMKDAAELHPRVKLLSFTPQKNSNNIIDRVDVSIEVVANREGDVELVTGLYSQTRSMPSVKDSKFIKINKTQVPLTFTLHPSGAENFSILGIEMYFKPTKEAYGADTIIDNYPVKGIKDNGQSIFEIIPDEDDRAVYYKVSLRSDVPPPKNGTKQLIDVNFNFGFSYSFTAEIDCKPNSSFPCGSSSELNLEVWPLDLSYFSQSDIKAGLLTKNLLCNDFSQERNSWCENTKVEDYTNSLGTKGYKIYRTKTIKINNPGAYDDHAYVFPLAKIIHDQNSIPSNPIDYSGILLSTDPSTEKHLLDLDAIAETYFSF